MPTIAIKGTDFIVDVTKFELREKADESNILYGEDFHKFEDGYGLYYDPEYKNWPSDGPYIPETVEYIRLPEFSKLDPEGMSLRSGKPLKDVLTMSDFDLLFDREAFDLRVNKGVLPTLDIAGHTFFVDISMDMLRPKNDFRSEGIVFSDIETYYNDDKRTYTIPYNPKTHEFQEPDYLTMKEFPKDLIAVEFSSERILDRIGWNRKYGFELTDGLEKIGFKLHHNARSIPWKNTFVAGLIERNIEAEKKRKATTEKQQLIQPKNKRTNRKI